MCRWLWFEWPNNDAFVQRISGDNLPVMENSLTESLTLCMRAQICLEAKRVDGRNES